MSSESLKIVRRAALNFLARRDYAELELQRRLEKAGHPIDEIKRVTETLIQQNLLSNLRFIENYIHFRRKKGFGPLRIRAELQQKGLAEEIFESHLKIHDTSWFSEVRRVWEKRFNNTPPEDFSVQAKHMRFLQGRGFTSEQIEQVFKS